MDRDNEVDLILKTGAHLIPIEIKSAQTFTSSFLKGLTYFKTLVGSRCESGYLIYAGKQVQRIQSFQLMNYNQMSANPVFSGQNHDDHDPTENGALQ